MARILPDFCAVLCIVCFVSFCVSFACKCVPYYCHQVATQLQLTNISYHIISSCPCTALLMFPTPLATLLLQFWSQIGSLLPLRWKQHILPNHWQPSTWLCKVTNKTTIYIGLCNIPSLYHSVLHSHEHKHISAVRKVTDLLCTSF